MSKTRATMQGTLAGLAFGVGVAGSCVSFNGYREGFSYDNTIAEAREYLSMAALFSIGSIAFYGLAGGLAITAVGNATREEN